MLISEQIKNFLRVNFWIFFFLYFLGGGEPSGPYGGERTWWRTIRIPIWRLWSNSMYLALSTGFCFRMGGMIYILYIVLIITPDGRLWKISHFQWWIKVEIPQVIFPGEISSVILFSNPTCFYWWFTGGSDGNSPVNHQWCVCWALTRKLRDRSTLLPHGCTSMYEPHTSPILEANLTDFPVLLLLIIKINTSLVHGRILYCNYKINSHVHVRMFNCN